MTITFDLDVVQPLKDFKTDDRELFHSESSHYKNSLPKQNLV